MGMKTRAKRCISLVILCFIPVLVRGQTGGDDPGQISGTVQATDGTKLPGVSISIKETEISTVTDDIGNYLLTDVSLGQFTIMASLPGFAEKELVVLLENQNTVTVDITLELAELQFEITVVLDTAELMNASESIGVVSVLPSQVAALPSLGEKDIFRSLQLMPGISATNEASAGLYIRGGTPDQNLVLFDGFTIYDVDHFFGIFSAFNANAIEDITIYKGGFESKYGSRISSVVDLTGKSGRSNEPSFGGGISFLSYNAYMDIPLGGRGSFMLAGRKSFQSPFSDRIRDNLSDSSAGPGGAGFGGRRGALFSVQPDSSFYDLNSRVLFDLTSRDSIMLSLYNGKDVLDSSRPININRSFFQNADGESTVTGDISGEITNLSNWGNTGLSLNWMRQWNDSFFSRFTVAHSYYFKDFDRTTDLTFVDPETGEEIIPDNEADGPRVSNRGSAEHNKLTDITVKVENDLTLNSRHHLEFGTQVTKNSIRYNFNFNQETAVFDRNDTATQYSLYLQDTWVPFPQLSITPGLRATFFDLNKKTYTDPRLSIILHATDRLRFKAAGGNYHQFANRLTREDVLQGDQQFWMLSDGDRIPVSSATHLIGGASYETQSLLFDVEAYQKKLSGLSEFASLRFGRRILEDFDLGTLFYTGSGTAEGIEFLAQKKFGRNTGWITYTLGRVEHYFPQLNPDPFSASHDSTHEFKIVDSFRFKRWTFSGTWVYATGKPFTEPIGFEELVFPNGRSLAILEFGDKNGIRLPSYHRLDLSASREFLIGETSKANLGISVFNVYNNRNVWRKEFDVIEDELIETDVNYLGLTVSAFLNIDLSLPSGNRKAGPAWNGAEAPDSGEPKSKEETKSEKVYDFYGTVESMTVNRLVVQTKWGVREFVMGPASIRGQTTHYDSGTYVHVYYKRLNGEDVVTMVVEKIK